MKRHFLFFLLTDLALLISATGITSAQTSGLCGGSPTKATRLEFVSHEGTATLMGISEYTSPSTPPRKFLKQTVKGEFFSCVMPGWPSCDGNNTNGNSNIYSGELVFDPVTGASVNSQINELHIGGAVPCGTHGPLGGQQALSGDGEGNFGVGGILTKTPTRKIWNANPTCTEFFGFARKEAGRTIMELSDEDTEDTAMARATMSSGVSNTAFRTSRGGGFTFSFRKVHFLAKFNVTCSGDYEVHLNYAVKPHGAAGPITREPKILRRRLESGGDETVEGDIVVQKTDTDYILESVEMRKSCLEQPPGSPAFELGSVKVSLGLGGDESGATAGQLRLEETSMTMALYTPALLVAATSQNGGVEIVREAGGALRQVKAPQALADIVTLGTTSYEVRFHSVDTIGAKDATTNTYAVSGVPFVTFRFENPDLDQATRLRITETRGGTARVIDYAFDTASATWSLRQGDGLRVESQISTIVAGDEVRTTTIRDAIGAAVSKVTRTYHTFAWGEEVVREVLDPDGAALTTLFEFYDDAVADGGAYAQLKQRLAANGAWERFSYDATGRPTKVVRPFLNSLATDPEDLGRVTETAYSALPDQDGDALPEELTTTVEKTLGQETARTHRVAWSRAVTLGGDVLTRRSEALSVAPGASWNAAGNLVTETLLYTTSPLIGRARRILNPDGTALLATYTLDAGGQQTAVIKTGQPNGTLDDILDGTRTVSITNPQGQVISETVADLASGLTLSAWTATAFDSLGRPARMDHSDGTYETRAYACCGLASQRDRSGAVTSYAYDALGRQTHVTRFGLTTRTDYDADGRVRSVTRIGTDGSEMVQETRTYDLAGRRAESRDPAGRLTRSSEIFDAATGETTRTTINPDGGTVVEVNARDGSRLSLSGTAVAPRVFESGVESGQLFTRDILVGDGGATTEWVKTFTDFAGRTARTVFADGATSTNHYNVLGQLAHTVDPDGVATLFAYNARGEQEVIALDLNGNRALDLGGTDRITRSVNAVATRDGLTVQRTTTQIWETDNQDTPTTVSISEQSSDGLRSWQTVRGLTTSSVTVLDGSGGRTITTTAPDGVKTIQVFNADRLASTTIKTAADVQLSVSTFGYDAHGRLQSATDARNGTTTFTYYADDQIHTVTTPDPDPALTGPGYDPQTTITTYDSAGRVSTVTQPDGGVVNTTYWPAGAVKRTWGARTYPVEYTYDPQGRVKTLTTWQNFAGDAGKAVTTWNYDPARGFLVEKRYTDGTGPSYTYKPSGRLLTRTWARTPVITTTYGYNAAGDLVTTDYSDTTPDVALAYDRPGRRKTRTDGSGVCQWAYHASGQIEDEAYTSGLLHGLGLDRSFDALSRLGSVSALSASSVLNQSGYSYDPASRLDTVISGTNTATYSYVPSSPLVGSITLQQGGTTQLTTTRAYDNLNRLTSISSVPSASSVVSAAYAYNAANQRTKLIRETNAYWDYGYDALGQVTSAVKKLPGGVPVLGHDFAFTFDDIGNRKSATVNSQTSNYTANFLNQHDARTVPGMVAVLGEAQPDATVTVSVGTGLPQPTTRQGDLFFRQMAADNSTAARYPDITITGVKNNAGPAGEDAVTEVTRSVFVPAAQETFAHDADGNLTADARWHYIWDGENRLLSVETIAAAIAAGAPKQQIEFAYDGQSRRVAKKVSNWNGSAWLLASHTLFLHDGWNLIAELDALNGNAPVRTYVWGLDLSGSFQGAGGVGGLLFASSSTLGSSLHAPCYDGNGNVIGYADMATGENSATYEYNAFGETISSDGPAKGLFPLGFSTKYHDQETGLLCYGFRYDHPQTGRWLSRDPMQENGGANLYGFIGNDPVDSIDPLGLFVRALPRLGPRVRVQPRPLFPPIPLQPQLPKTKLTPRGTPDDEDYQTQDPDNPNHGGKFDANWCNLHRKVEWSQPFPLTKTQALVLLDQLESMLSRSIQRDLAPAFEKARNFVRSRDPLGLVAPPVYIRSWPIRGTKSDRVDVEVIRGRAFNDDGLKFLRPGRGLNFPPDDVI